MNKINIREEPGSFLYPYRNFGIEEDFVSYLAESENGDVKEYADEIYRHKIEFEDGLYPDVRVGLASMTRLADLNEINNKLHLTDGWRTVSGEFSPVRLNPPESGILSDVKYEIANLGYRYWFYNIGLLDEGYLLDVSRFTPNDLVSYMQKPYFGYNAYKLAYLDFDLFRLEYPYKGMTNVDFYNYSVDVVTFAGAYHTVSSAQTEELGYRGYARVMSCERIFIPGFYGKTGERMKLCYLEIKVPSFYSDVDAVNSYVVNPSEYAVHESEIKTLRMQIHKTNYVVNSAVEYTKHWSTNGYYNDKEKLIGTRLVPIWVNEKGDDKMGYSPRLKPKSMIALVMTRASLNELNKVMWDSATWLKWFSLYNGGLKEYVGRLLMNSKDVAKNIVSCKWFFNLDEKKLKAVDSEVPVVRLGKIDINLTTKFATTDEETAVLVDVDFPMGEVGYESLVSAYSTYDLYLPYYGYVNLPDVHEYETLEIRLVGNVVTGTGYWIISTPTRFICCVECQIGIDVPIMASKNDDLVDNTIRNLAPTAVKSGMGFVVGGPVGAVGGAVVGAVGNVIGNDSSYGSAVTSMVGNDGILCGMNSIFLTVKRPILYDMSGFGGYDSNTKGKVSSFKKYVKARDVNKESFGGIPAWAVEEIETKLKAGVYINP